MFRVGIITQITHTHWSRESYRQIRLQTNTAAIRTASYCCFGGIGSPLPSRQADNLTEREYKAGEMKKKGAVVQIGTKNNKHSTEPVTNPPEHRRARALGQSACAR